jgi:PAS domain-containing protein
LTPVSKAPFSFDKWLILKTSEQGGTSVASPEAGGTVTPATPGLAPRQRSPTGHPGLPCEWLFSVALQPVMIIDATTGQIRQANPAAAELLRTPERMLIGAPVLGIFDASSTTVLTHSIEAACAKGAAEPVTLRTAGDGTELSAKVSLFRAEADSYLLFRLASTADPAVEQASSAGQTPVFDAIESASVGFLVTDSGLRVEYANQSFMDMVGLPAPGQMHGKSLARWLELSEEDLARLQGQMARREASSVMITSLRSERNLLREVEVCAVAVPDDQLTCWGFTVRELPRLN